ncbi:MAG: deoxyribose-phosphate aldolase [Spirochaetales bacterium]|nr:deoxyribose-phosphate aldolase [Spirochaetales bacterium]
MTQKDLCATFDHTLLNPLATQEAIRQLCREAAEWQFATVCVNSSYVLEASQLLKGEAVGVCAVAGFPLGADTTRTKQAQARQAVEDGASEIDMVLNLGWVKDQRWAELEAEIKAVCDAACVPVKVILETCYLTDAEIVKACHLSENAGAFMVKTSTGWGPGGATPESVRLMRSSVSPRMLVKASGGIRSLATCLVMLDAGASRIGSSSSVAIIKEFAYEH